MIRSLIIFINIAENVLSLLIIVHVVLSYFMSPYHPIREMVDRIIEPLLAPIRRVVPTVGMFDFSPLILLIGIQLLSGIIVAILQGLY